MLFVKHVLNAIKQILIASTNSASIVKSKETKLCTNISAWILGKNWSTLQGAEIHACLLRITLKTITFNKTFIVIAAKYKKIWNIYYELIKLNCLLYSATSFVSIKLKALRIYVFKII